MGLAIRDTEKNTIEARLTDLEIVISRSKEGVIKYEVMLAKGIDQASKEATFGDVMLKERMRNADLQWCNWFVHLYVMNIRINAGSISEQKHLISLNVSLFNFVVFIQPLTKFNSINTVFELHFNLEQNRRLGLQHSYLFLFQHYFSMAYAQSYFHEPLFNCFSIVNLSLS